MSASCVTGSGKSTLAHHLRRELALETVKVPRSKQLLLGVYCNLPTMKNPLTSLMQEALKSEYNLSGPQIKSLRERAAKGEVLLVILCDGGSLQCLCPSMPVPVSACAQMLSIHRLLCPTVDELHVKFKRKALCDANDLESWGKKKLGPLVLFFMRAEEAAPDYEQAFMPIKTGCEDQCDESQAKKHFREFRIAIFKDKLQSM